MKNNHYQTLGVSPKATAPEIKAAYKRLALRFHPDKNPGNQHAEERFKQINQAYQVLSNPRSRASFDLQVQYEQQQRQAQAYATPRYHHTRRPAGFQERHYRERPQKHTHFSRRDVQIIIGVVVAAVLLVVLLKLGWDHLASGRALKQAQEAEQRQDWTQAQGAYSDVLEYKPDLPEARVKRAQLRLVRLQDPAGAIEDYTQALQAQENPPAHWFAARGKAYLQTKAYQHALPDLNRALQLNPNQPDVFLDRALVHLQLEDNWPQAEADLSTYLASPEKPQENIADVLLYRAFTFYRLGKYEQAWQDTRQALQANAQDPKAFYLQAKVKQAQKDTVAACALLAKAAQLGFAGAQEELTRVCPTMP